MYVCIYIYIVLVLFFVLNFCNLFIYIIRYRITKRNWFIS